MAQIKSQLATQKREQSVTFKVGNDDVKLSPSIIRSYLVNGNGNVTDQEINYFIHLCRGQGLNPFLKEIYLIKYGDKNPATFVVSKEAFLKRAENNPQYDGNESGIIVLNEETGEVEERKGSFCLSHEKVVGGWAKVYRKDRKYPSEAYVSFDEYVGKKGDGTPNSNWATRPATMIKKVALVQALREAFPNDLNNLYTEEEQSENQIDLSTIQPIETQVVEEAPVQQFVQQPAPQEIIQEQEYNPLGL